MQIGIEYFRDKSFPSCPPLDELQSLLQANKLPHFLAQWPGSRDCHYISDALLADLREVSQFNWRQCREMCRIGFHSWLEEPSGWAVDASNGVDHGVWILRATALRDYLGADEAPTRRAKKDNTKNVPKRPFQLASAWL
jgi:hypothetical protein